MEIRYNFVIAICSKKCLLCLIFFWSENINSSFWLAYDLVPERYFFSLPTNFGLTTCMQLMSNAVVCMYICMNFDWIWHKDSYFSNHIVMQMCQRTFSQKYLAIMNFTDNRYFHSTCTCCENVKNLLPFPLLQIMELFTLFNATQVSKVFAFWTDKGLPVKKKNKYLFSLHLQLGMQSHIPLTTFPY